MNIIYVLEEISAYGEYTRLAGAYSTLELAKQACNQLVKDYSGKWYSDAECTWFEPVGFFDETYWRICHVPLDNPPLKIDSY